jgi:hypothetical protein
MTPEGKTNAAGRPEADRVLAYEVARSPATLGMAVVHSSLVMAADRTAPAWLAEVLGLLDGRAAATFVSLAGVGSGPDAPSTGASESTARAVVRLPDAAQEAEHHFTGRLAHLPAAVLASSSGRAYAEGRPSFTRRAAP